MPSLLIVSEIRLFREGLAELLSRQAGLWVLATAMRCEQALEQVHRHDPEVIVLDQALPDSLRLARALAGSHPHVHVVALGVPDAGESVLAFAEAGVAGYVPRDGSVQDLVLAIEGAARGELHCSPLLAGTIARRLALLAAAAPEASGALLTAREAEVVKLIALGRSNKEIAGALGIEVATVKNHVHKVLEKLHLRRRAEVAARVGGWAQSQPAASLR